MYLEKDEKKFTILYAVGKYSTPISVEKLYSILTWDKEIMEYFEIAEMVDELLKDGYLEKTFYRNEECFALTAEGVKANKFFAERCPKSIRDRIDAEIGTSRFAEVKDPNLVKGEARPLSHSEYAAKLTIFDNKTPMLDLTINMGSRPQAERVAKYFEENSGEIYQEILKILNPDK